MIRCPGSSVFFPSPPSLRGRRMVSPGAALQGPTGEVVWPRGGWRERGSSPPSLSPSPRFCKFIDFVRSQCRLPPSLAPPHRLRAHRGGEGRNPHTRGSGRADSNSQSQPRTGQRGRPTVTYLGAGRPYHLPDRGPGPCGEVQPVETIPSRPPGPSGPGPVRFQLVETTLSSLPPGGGTVGFEPQIIHQYFRTTTKSKSSNISNGSYSHADQRIHEVQHHQHVAKQFF